MDSGKILLGAMAGVALGATLGILFAPNKGSDTRKKISKKSTEYVGGLENQFREFMKSVSDRFEQMTAEAQKVSNNGRTKAEELLKDAAKAVHPKD